MAKMYKLTLDEGATNELAITLSEDGVPTDLTGCSFMLRLRPDPCSEIILLDLPTEGLGGYVIDDPLTGRVVFTFEPAATCGATWQNAVFTVEMTDTLGRILRVLQGPVVLVPGGICE